MNKTFHIQSLIAGAVVCAALMMLVAPSFGARGRYATQPYASQPHQNEYDNTKQEVGGETTVIVTQGRFQLVTGDNRIAYLIDTETGEVWKDRDFSETPMSSRNFFEHKIHNH